MTKLCIDCKWCTASNADQSRDRNPMCMKGAKSPVDGSYIETCGSQRGLWGVPATIGSISGTNIIPSQCGPSGNWWEARAKASTATP